LQAKTGTSRAGSVGSNCMPHALEAASEAESWISDGFTS